jgi:hypothetical protein
MTDSPQPIVIRYQLEHTPSPNDPEDAPRFYQALGIFVMAWGRLEAHFLACILDMIQTPRLQLSQKFPHNSDYIKIWDDAFTKLPLRDHQTEALEFSIRLSLLGDKRSKIIHGHWEPFNRPPVSVLSADVVTLRRKSKTEFKIHRFSVNTDFLLDLAREASEMNMQLYKFKQIVSAVRGPRPSSARKF